MATLKKIHVKSSYCLLNNQTNGPIIFEVLEQKNLTVGVDSFNNFM